MNTNFDTLYNSDVLEAIKTLRTNLEFAGMDNPLKCISVTSTFASEGKTTISLTLGIAMGETGKKTIIVENDFRHPQIAKRIEKRMPLGITDLLTEKNTLEEVIYETEFNNLYMLNVGKRIANPVEVLGSNKYLKIMEELKEKFDFVIFDTPPMGLFIDGAVIASRVDGVILVVNSGTVPANEVKETLDQLEKAKANILGVVLNAVSDENGYRKSNYYYRYRYMNKDGQRTADK